MSDVKDTKPAEAGYLGKLLASMRLNPAPATKSAMIKQNLDGVVEEADPENRFLSELAALLHNYDPQARTASAHFDKGQVQKVISRIDQMINDQLNEVLHQKEFLAAEAAWRGLDDLVANTNFKANICIDILDVSQKELHEDFENNSSFIFGSALFKKVYIDEYDQFGGRPYGAMVGLYEFTHNNADLFWLDTMGKLANAAHAPFISAISHKFLGCETIEEVDAIKDLEGIIGQPKYGRWNKLRDSEHAAYLGLTFPRYILRLPWNPETNPCTTLNFTETAQGQHDKYLWGNAAILLARNLVKSFATAGWCQYLRGPKGGGLITGLPVDTFPLRGHEALQVIMPPVEVTIPDYRELEFARVGLIPLVYRKESAEAAFFSVQSAKRTLRFKNPRDSENSQLVANLAYTFSVTRIAHYIKSIMRDNIGTTADEVYIQRILSDWLMGYVTIVNNPDDLTLRHYPFKAATVKVAKRPGEIGWYDCSVAVLPHIQFEGMNVELRLESRLGAAG